MHKKKHSTENLTSSRSGQSGFSMPGMVKKNSIKLKIEQHVLGVNRFISAIGSSKKMYKFIKQLVSEYKHGKGYYRMKKRTTLTGEQEEANNSAQVQKFTKYKFYKETIDQLEAFYQKDKKQFKKTFFIEEEFKSDELSVQSKAPGSRRASI